MPQEESGSYLKRAFLTHWLFEKHSLECVPTQRKQDLIRRPEYRSFLHPDTF